MAKRFSLNILLTAIRINDGAYPRASVIDALGHGIDGEVAPL